MKLKTKKILAFTTITLSIVAILGSISYAYFTAMTDNTPQEVSGNTGVMKLTFSDGDSGTNAKLNFGESVTKKFILENTGTVDSTVKINWLNLINTYTIGSLTYTLTYSEAEDGSYNEAIDKMNVPISKNPIKKVLATNLTVPVGKTYYYDLVITLNYLEDVNQDDDLDATFSSEFEVEDITDYTPIEKIMALSNGVKSRFDEPATTDEGVFEMADDYGTSYYYRGAVENNYVKFAGFYWRIIRVNGDGSLRIIYDGTKAHTNSDSSTDRFTHTSKIYNANGNDAKYVGWMYGPTGTTASTSKTQAQTNTASSDIKIVVDSWYKTNIADKGYGSAVADVIFCNDRSTPGKTATGWSIDTGLGYGRNVTAFGTIARYGWSGTAGYDNPKPQFTCPQKNDAFTVSDTSKGNGALTYPVGLIIGDEIVAAGSGKYNTTNRNYYLYKTSGYWYWSLSPRYFNGNGANVFSVDSSDGLTHGFVYDSGAVAPVINLSAEYVSTLKGTGTMNDPYRASNVIP